MSTARYNEVIHKATGEYVSVFKFLNDATWIGREKDKLIAKPNYCEFGKEVNMIMVKDYIKSNGKEVNAYFRKKSGETGILNNNMSGESESHRKAKENVRDMLCNGKLNINGEKLEIKDIKDITIEYRTGKDGYVIPDVIILFKNIHPKYGLGIFFEIQFSKQSKKKTIERTYYRVIDGFSGVWLSRNNFDDNLEFIGDDIDIKSHKALLIDIEREMENSFINRLNNYGRVIDNKLIDYKNKIENISNRKYKELFQENKELREVKSSINESYNLWKEINVEEISNSIGYKVKEILKNSVISIEPKINNIKEKYMHLANEEIKNKISEEIKNIKITQIYTKKCPVCKKQMRVGKSMSGTNWYCIDYPMCSGFERNVKVKEVLADES